MSHFSFDTCYKRLMLLEGETSSVAKWREKCIYAQCLDKGEVGGNNRYSISVVYWNSVAVLLLAIVLLVLTVSSYKLV